MNNYKMLSNVELEIISNQPLALKLALLDAYKEIEKLQEYKEGYLFIMKGYEIYNNLNAKE